jgi:hypothetical protein
MAVMLNTEPPVDSTVSRKPTPASLTMREVAPPTG